MRPRTADARNAPQVRQAGIARGFRHGQVRGMSGRDPHRAALAPKVTPYAPTGGRHLSDRPRRVSPSQGSILIEIRLDVGASASCPEFNRYDVTSSRTSGQVAVGPCYEAEEDVPGSGFHESTLGTERGRVITASRGGGCVGRWSMYTRASGPRQASRNLLSCNPGDTPVRRRSASRAPVLEHKRGIHLTPCPGEAYAAHRGRCSSRRTSARGVRASRVRTLKLRSPRPRPRKAVAAAGNRRVAPADSEQPPARRALPWRGDGGRITWECSRAARWRRPLSSRLPSNIARSA